MQAIKGARAARGAEHGGRGGPRRVDLLCGFAGGEAKGSLLVAVNPMRFEAMRIWLV